MALHELAHVVLGHTSSAVAQYGRQIEAEAEAWCWALEHALEAPSAKVSARISFSLWSYYRALKPTETCLNYYGVPGSSFRRVGRMINDNRIARLYRLPVRLQRALKASANLTEEE